MIKCSNDFFTGQHEKILIKTAGHERLLNALGDGSSKQKNVT